ncbi:MAG: hypothetical protein OEZ39_19840 [Gammaproteobacteria bacterium]|nr:hypothetical protein [Gammaproteobacteria bacterium]MDH5654120.1 hypothetical protein [Gammaproteobacteria bacterium]
MWKSRKILKVLDECAESFTFPMLDNGYVYLAATRMSLFRSTDDWAIVIEVFGYSPRTGIPDIHIYTFSSKLHNRDPEASYVSKDAYNNYLACNPYNESRFIFPIENEDWMDEEDTEKVRSGVCISVRGKKMGPFELDLYNSQSIELVEESPMVFELARLLAAIDRESVLALDDERRISVSPELDEILVLDEWFHPDLVNEDLPSGNETFQQLARVLETCDVSLYNPTKAPNTAWVNWPDGGLL